MSVVSVRTIPDSDILLYVYVRALVYQDCQYDSR